MASKKSKFIYWSLGLFIAFAAVYSFIGQPSAEVRERQISAQFSPIDGKHLKLAELIKQDLQNPGSYKNVETNFSDVDTAIIVNQQFSFEDENGTRKSGFVKALVDNKENVIILERR